MQHTAHYSPENRQLTALAKALHDRGMYLLLDVVVNHMASSSLPTPFSAYTPFKQAAELYPFCLIPDYNNRMRPTIAQTCVSRTFLRPSQTHAKQCT